MASALNEILERLKALPQKQYDEALQEIAKSPVGSMPMVPNPGPQTDAWFCEADELFYGGEAGGGKTGLLAGLATTAHLRSLVLRRTNKEADKLVDEFEKFIGSRTGWNGQAGVWRLQGGRTIDLGGCQLESDKQKRKGIPHDLKAFDEIGDFLESQYTFIIAWNRSTTPGQRCRIVVTGNPPTTAEGLWVVRRWAAWLDPRHPYPAKPGELRWYTTVKGVDTEMDGPGPHVIDKEGGGTEVVMAKSRTFIRARLDDNPDLTRDGQYAATLAALPEEYRAAYRDGNFQAGLKDKAYQVIPSQWVFDAQKRWEPGPPRMPGRPNEFIPMTSISLDAASGGVDRNVLSRRHDGWFDELVVKPGTETPYGSHHASFILENRRNSAEIIIDMGGGYGNAARMRLLDNNIRSVAWNGAKKSKRRTRDNKLAFYLKRDQAYWQFREALDPDQVGGSPIALPPDPELMADLLAPCFEIGAHGIKITDKVDVVKDLGRSPDKGDAVVMCWQAGRSLTMVSDDIVAQGIEDQEMGLRRGQYSAQPRVVLQKPKRR